MRLPDLSTELTYAATRGSGPGGQHVNKANTKVELRWALASSTGFSESEKARLSAKLAHRLTQDGELVLTDHSTRSQARNREEVTERFYAILEGALKREKRRKRTKPTYASKKRRLDGKRRRGEKKATRGRVRY